MEQTTILHKLYNIYWEDNFDLINNTDLNNRLLCSFSSLEGLDILIENIKSSYTIMYNKMFVLYVKSTDEYVITYNIEQGNVNNMPSNTILVHRKKEHNVLYTINALNELIKKLNGGVVNPAFPIEWQHYRNSILLTTQNELKQLNTKIHKIIEL